MPKKSGTGKSNPNFSKKQYDILVRCSINKALSQWNQWRKNNNGKEILLSKANFIAANLRDSNLAGANLSRTNLSGADLTGAKLNAAYLENAKLNSTILRNTDLQGAILTNVTGLLADQLGGADISESVPQQNIENFDKALERVSEASKNTRHLINTIIAALTLFD